ncbi:MAG TPA: GNAT family N-acetyltransferase [bacterium]|nr:GNAT family N-acetyltransferase [bacterium]
MRVIGAWNAIIPCGPLAAATADAVISEQVAFFHRLASARDARRDGNGAADLPPLGDSPEVEWKVYGHDRPADLGARLAAAGFESDEPETLMVFDLRGGLPDVPNDGTIARGIDVRRVTDAPGLADLTEAARAAFGRDPAWRAERMKQYERQLADPAVSFYVVHAAGRPVASARVDFPRGRSFAGLWGGGTVPTYRGRGIYRALVRVRAEEARRRGYRYLRVDARETSRPILDRLGFMPLARIVEWRLRL